MRGPLVVIGQPSSTFVQAPVRFWRRCGVEAVIVTARWDGDQVADGLPVLSAERLASTPARRAAAATVPFLERLDAASARSDAERHAHAMRTWGADAVPPSLAPPVHDGLLIASALDSLRPSAVLAHEAFAYGLAAQLSEAPRKSIFVWGADVLHYAETSDAAFSMVGDALQSVRYVLAGSESIRERLHDRFALPLERIVHLHYGVDLEQFRPADEARAARIRSAHGIPPQARVVMNIRRFLPHWGAPTVQRAAASLLARRHDVHLVLLEGSSGDSRMDGWLSQLESRGWRDRVSVVRGHAPLHQVAELMSVSDVCLSLVDSLEPCSLSVLQAAAAGGQLVIADQETYRALCREGLHAALVAPGDDAGLIDAVLEQLDDAVASADMARANRSFISGRFDHRAAMLRLLRIVAGETAYRPSDRQDCSGWLSAQATKPGSEIAY